MKIGSKYKFSEVETRHWDAFFQAAGLSKTQAKKRVLQIAQTLPAAAQQLQTSRAHGFADKTVTLRICSLIEQRCALTIKRLSEPGIGDEADKRQK